MRRHVDDCGWHDDVHCYLFEVLQRGLTPPRLLHLEQQVGVLVQLVGERRVGAGNAPRTVKRWQVQQPPHRLRLPDNFVCSFNSLLFLAGLT